MYLSGSQRRELQDALIDAFPSKSSLEQMLLFKLNKNLRAIAGEGSLQEIVFELITKANSQGWIEDLIRSSREANPGNSLLESVSKKLLESSPFPPIPEGDYFSRRLAVIVGVITTGTIFSIALVYNQLQNAENKPSDPISTKNITTLKPTRNAKDFYDLGISKYKKEEYDKAIQFYNKAIELDPDNPDYYYSRGLANFHSENYKEAIQDCDKAITLNSKNYKYYALCGYARRLSEDYKEAIQDYTNAILYGEGKYEKYYHYYEIRADIHWNLRNKDKATDDYQEAIRLYKKNGDEELRKRAQTKLDGILSK